MGTVIILVLCAIVYIAVCEGICNAVGAESFKSKAIVYAVVSSVAGLVISHI